MNIFSSILLSLSMMAAPAAGAIPEMDQISYQQSLEIKLDIKTTLVSGNAVKVGYEIPYDGFIEFRLFSPEGEKMWTGYYVATKGEHFVPIKRTNLEDGQTYSFKFFYKGKAFPGTFKNA